MPVVLQLSCTASSTSDLVSYYLLGFVNYANIPAYNAILIFLYNGPIMVRNAPIMLQVVPTMLKALA